MKNGSLVPRLPSHVREGGEPGEGRRVGGGLRIGGGERREGRVEVGGV